jgi:hypothetical protein
MDNSEKILLLKKLLEYSKYFDYDDAYKHHVKKIKKEIKRIRGDDK